MPEPTVRMNLQREPATESVPSARVCLLGDPIVCNDRRNCRQLLVDFPRGIRIFTTLSCSILFACICAKPATSKASTDRRRTGKMKTLNVCSIFRPGTLLVFWRCVIAVYAQRLPPVYPPPPTPPRSVSSNLSKLEMPSVIVIERAARHLLPLNC